MCDWNSVCNLTVAKSLICDAISTFVSTRSCWNLSQDKIWKFISQYVFVSMTAIFRMCLCVHVSAHLHTALYVWVDVYLYLFNVCSIIPSDVHLYTFNVRFDLPFCLYVLHVCVSLTAYFSICFCVVCVHVCVWVWDGQSFVVHAGMC